MLYRRCRGGLGDLTYISPRGASSSEAGGSAENWAGVIPSCSFPHLVAAVASTSSDSIGLRGCGKCGVGEAMGEVPSLLLPPRQSDRISTEHDHFARSTGQAQDHA